MKRWTVVLKTVGHLNGTGEYVFSVRAATEAEAEEKAQEAFDIRDAEYQKRKKFPCTYKRRHRPSLKEIICWDATV